MKKIALILFSICFLVTASAQWTQFPGIPASANIECIRTTDASHFYAGTSNAILKTDDAGSTWQTILINDATGNIIPSIITDVYFVSSTEAVAVGWIALGNSEVILRTTNGGLNWSYANVYNGGTYPREQNALEFSTATTGYSVGSNGRILKTNNSGNTWFTLASGITTELFDVDFTSASTGYAVGNARILKTTNGSTWSPLGFPGKVFKAVHFPSASVGYAAGDAGVLYKTTNSGTSWTQITTTDPYIDFTSVFFTDDLTGYLTGNHFIYRTTTGGQYWERLQMTETMNDIFFLSAQDGLACGNDSQFYHTSNSGLPYKPQPAFNITPATLCYDSLVTLTNLSDPNWTFEWLLNGVPFSTNFSTSLVVPNAGSSTISLVAYNGFERDTLHKPITIQPTLDIDLNIGVVSEICAGQSGQVQVFNSEVGTTYRLRQGVSSIGVQQYGDGGTLTFSTGSISATTTFNIRAIRSNVCGSIEEVAYVDVVTQNPDINKVIYATLNPICPGGSTSVLLESSQNGVSYTLMNGTNAIGTSQTGNGGTLTFPTPVLMANTTYFIRGTSSPLSCITNFPALTIVVEYPTLYFSPTTSNPEINESVAFLNNTTNPGGTFNWNFGSDATPQFSSTQNVSAVQFSTPGVHAVTLTATTSVGCVSQLTKEINVIDPVTVESCSIIHYAGSSNYVSGRLLALTRDDNSNLFTVYKNDYTDSLYIYSGNGDTILNNMVPIPNYDEYFSISKHNEKGVPMWSTYLRFDSPWAKCGDVVTDDSGNLYFVYYHGDHTDDARIYSADGRYITIDPPTNGVGHSSVIVKYDSNGMYLWHTTVFDNYGLERVSLKLDESGNILYTGSNFYKLAPNGTVLNSILTQNKADSEPDGQGGAYITGSGFGFEYIGPGTGIPSPTYTSNNANIVTSFITMDEDHNIYLVGQFHGEFEYNGVVYSDIYLGGSPHEDIFLCKINNDGTPGWFKQFQSDQENSVRGLAIKNGLIVFAMQTYGQTFTNLGGPALTGLNGSRCDVLFKCGTDGNNANMILFQESSSPYGVINDLDLVYLNDDATKIDFGFEFRNTFTTPPGVQANAFPNATYGNAGIQQGDPDCLFAIPELPPVTEFSSAASVCTDTELTFTDQSTNIPSSWSWTFPGGTPATSTDQNPEVSFAAPGIYTVTLTASNQFGAGTTSTHQVTVNEAADDDNWILQDSLCYAEDGIPVQGGQFNNGYYALSNTSEIIDNVFLPSLNAIGEYTVITHYYTDPNVGCAGVAIDSIFTNALPNVNLAPFTEDTLCFENQGIPLTNGTPAGGTFTDNFSSTITGNVLFPPANALFSMLNVYYSYTNPSSGCFNVDTASVYLDECLSLADLSANTPQIATLIGGKQYRILNLDSKFESSVVDSRGQKVLNLVNQNTIDLEPFAPGVYFVQVSVGNSKYAFKVNRY